MTNERIYNIAKGLLDNFQSPNQVLPIRVNFYLQKNKKEILALAQEIDNERVAIIKRYLQTMPDGEVKVPEEQVQEVNNLLNELFSLEQEVGIYKVNLTDFGNINLTTGQMDALMFMVEGE